MQWLLSNLNPRLSSKHDPKMAMATSHAKKINTDHHIQVMGRQRLLVDAFNAMMKAMKQWIRLSISAKTLPGMSHLQSPLFHDQERLRAERAELNAKNPASQLHPPIQQSMDSPLHASTFQDASNQPQNMSLELKETF